MFSLCWLCKIIRLFTKDVDACLHLTLLPFCPAGAQTEPPSVFFLCYSFRLAFFCSSKYWPYLILADFTWRFIAGVNGSLVKWSSSVEILSWTVHRATTVFSWRFSMCRSMLTESPCSTEAWPCEFVRCILKDITELGKLDVILHGF